VQGDPNARLSPEEQRLQTLKGELSVALSTLSETNPRVRNLQAQVDALTETALDISLAEIDSRTNALQQEIKEANAELESLRVSIERTPANGILLAGMEREQENIQNLYKPLCQMNPPVQTANKSLR